MTDARTALPIQLGLRIVGGATLLLWGLGVAVDVWRASLEATALGRTLVACLDLDGEQTIAAWFSSSMLLAGACLWVLGGLRARTAASGSPTPWFVAAAVAAFLSLDESVGLHERLGNAVHRAMPGLALETFAWILPGACFALATLVLLFRFLARQTRLLRRRIWVAVACFFGGAIGVEAAGAWISMHVGKASVLFQLEVWVEEGLELAGVFLCLRALALHLQPVPRQSRGNSSPDAPTTRQ